MPQHDKVLLKEMKKAYELHNQGKFDAFDEVLVRIATEFGNNMARMAEKLANAWSDENDRHSKRKN